VPRCYVWRNDDSKAINNNVRDLFLRSILAVCGVSRIDQLPANVQAVMKEDDYRGGHPLTARRITAVKNAIDASLRVEADEAKTRIELQLARDMPNVPLVTRSQNAQRLVELAKGDVELIHMLADERHYRLASNILRRDDRNFNDMAEIEQRVEGLRRNLNEVRRVANNDRAFFEQILNHLNYIEELPLPDGQIERMVTATQNLNFGPVRNLLDDLSYNKGLEAFFRLQKMVNSVVAEAGLPVAEDPEEAQGDLHCKYKFIYAMIFDNFGEENRRLLLNQLAKPKLGDDCKAMVAIAIGTWDEGGDEEPLKTNIKNFAWSLAHTSASVVREVLKDSLDGGANLPNLPFISWLGQVPPGDVLPVYTLIKRVLPDVDDNADNANPNVGEVPEPNVGEVPEPEVDNDDDMIAVEEHEPPAFVNGLEPRTKDDFMRLFYDEAISRTVAGGRSKEDCDATIKAMFDTVGEDGNDRKYLAELLACGKPTFLAERGRLPSHDDAVAFARDVKAVLEQAKRCRASFAEPYGGIVAETILSTLKTMEHMVPADELEPIDADLGARLYDAAGELDTADVLAQPRYNAQIMKGLNEKLENFQQQVDAKFESVFPGNGGSPFMQAVKKNVIMNLALMGAGHKARALASALEEYGDALGVRHGKRDMLDVLQLVLKRVPKVA